MTPPPRPSPSGSAEEWRPFEFDDAGATRWAEQGFAVFEAALARDDGYSPYNAPHDPAGAERIRQRWMGAGFEPAEGRRWHQWNFTATEAARWRDAGFGLARASQWRAMGSSPETAANEDGSAAESGGARS